MNPDGAEFDIKDGRFHYWRKNRQPNAGTSTIGTDLNRNYGYRWGGGGRTSTQPAGDHVPRARRRSPRPRPGRCATSSPSRVVDGRQQIRAAITFHEAGRLVMWPYGYTKTERPADMTADDHCALRDDRPAHGGDQRLHARAGERPVHHARHVARLRCTGRTGSSRTRSRCRSKDYPTDAMIAPETGRNKEAVLYLAERACVPAGACSATAVRRRALRRVRRRLRGRPRLDGQPGRDRHRARDGALGPRQPGGHVVRRRGAPARRRRRRGGSRS